MSSLLPQFETIVRQAHSIHQSKTDDEKASHPFDERNIHPEIATVAQKLFDNGHYSQATFEAFKYLDKKVSEISGVQESGQKLMMTAFSETNPPIWLTNLSSR